MPIRPPFDMLRACFVLLAIVVLIMMAETLLALAGCAWIVAVQGREPLGACQSMGATIRDLFSELLTGILALLVAAGRPPGSPPPGPPGRGTAENETGEGNHPPPRLAAV